MDFGTYIENLKGINMQTLCAEALKTFEVFLADLNAEQMRFGLNSDGKEIGYYMSQVYADWKKSRGGLAPSGVVDLFLTGAFSQGIFAEVKTDTILFDSKDDKSNMLQEKYDRNGKIFGLSDKAKSILIEPLLAEIIERINIKLAA
jgi:hypothetical protein